MPLHKCADVVGFVVQLSTQLTVYVREPVVVGRLQQDERPRQPSVPGVFRGMI